MKNYVIFPIFAALCGCSSTSIVVAGDGGPAGAAGIGSAGAGTGGSAGVAGTSGSAGAGTSGSGGSGGSGGGTCTPKKCATMAYTLTDGGATTGACGVFPDDGCGNVLDCGGCSDPVQMCGGNNAPYIDPAIPQVCSHGRCISTGQSANCSSFGQIVVVCPNENENVNPADYAKNPDGTLILKSCEWRTAGPTDMHWCCNS